MTRTTWSTRGANPEAKCLRVIGSAPGIHYDEDVLKALKQMVDNDLRNHLNQMSMDKMLTWVMGGQDNGWNQRTGAIILELTSKCLYQTGTRSNFCPGAPIIRRHLHCSNTKANQSPHEPTQHCECSKKYPLKYTIAFSFKNHTSSPTNTIQNVDHTIYDGKMNIVLNYLNWKADDHGKSLSQYTI